MSIKAVKSLVARLHADSQLRDSYASDPDGVLSRYKLTSDEKVSLKRATLRVAPDGTLTLAQDTPLDWWMA